MPFDAEAAALLIDLAGTPGFGVHLLEMAASQSGIEEIFGYVTDDQGPQVLISASAIDHQSQRVEAYSRRYFRHDPAVRDVTALHPGANFTQTVTANQIASPDYRKVCFDVPKFAGKLCFGWRGAHHTLVLNFYRRHGMPDVGLEGLGAIAELALAALHRRMHARGSNEAFLETLETRIRTEYPLLSARERQVLARTLTGEHADDTAAMLNMARGTVLTYRQRAYQKYGLGNASAFLSRLL